jgi:sialate O-acetylesterase
MPAYADASWKTAPAGLGPWALWDGGAGPDGFIGQMWMRTSVALTAEQAAKAGAELDLGSVNQEDETWLNGAYLGASSFSSRTRYPIPAGTLKAGVNVVATNIYCGWRDCGLRGAAESRAVRFGDGTSVPLSGPWKARQMPDGVVGPQLPWGTVHGMALRHNGMIRPVGAYNFRGAVWYQGESDVHFGADYYVSALGALMGEWRRQFSAPTLPVLVVQLPGYGPVPSGPVASSTWADLREAQRRAVNADAHAALAVTIDIGNKADLHPTNKREVGHRLGIAARHLIYGDKRAPSGAVVDSITRRGPDVVVTFRDVTGALFMHSEDPSGFELCGPTQDSCRWVKAEVGDTTVVLPNAGNATRVRYAWGPTPASPLYDDGELPAGPFEEPIR